MENSVTLYHQHIHRKWLILLYPEQFADVEPAVRIDEIMVSLVGGNTYDVMAEAYYGGYQQLTFD